MFKKAKSRPSLRAKEQDDPLPSSPLSKSHLAATPGDSPSTSIDIDQDDEEVASGSGSGSVMERKKAKGKEKRRGPVSRLSFGGEAEEDGGGGGGFKPRKSLLSQSVRASIGLGDGEGSSVGNGNGNSSPSGNGSTSIYSREYLSQLKASTPTRAPRATVNDEEGGVSTSTIARGKYAMMEMEDTTAGIPDEAAIASAKMKRQAAVENGKHNGGLGQGGEDYIALSAGGGGLVVHDGREGPHPESRLMREEDEEGEGDEELADYTEANERLFLGKKANKAAARRMKGEIGELIADREDEDSDDEETKEWEMAQARRAGGWDDEKPEKPRKVAYRAHPIPNPKPLPTLGPAQARLAKHLAELQVIETESTHNLEVAATNLAGLEEQERDLRREVERVEGKREWVEEFRGWVELLGSFLEEKMPKLQDIEADALHHFKERADLVNKRRAADDSDDLALFLGIPAPTAEDTKDDQGRSLNMEAGPSSTTRRTRRQARQIRRSRRAQAKQPEDEGFSTDSSLADDDASDYAAAQGVLERRVVALLEDVKAEDFRDPVKGLAVRFGGWRERFGEEYGNAFGGLAVVQAWEFWARGEMVGWEPLRGNSSLESFSWFTALHDYSHPRIPTNGNTEEDDMDLDEEPPLGPDGDRVAEMVSKAVVPLLTQAFEAGAYDPYSASQTRRAVDLADVVAELTGKDSRKYTSLLRAIFTVYHNTLLSLSSTITNSTLPSSMPPPAFDPSSRPAMQRYIHKRLKLLRNILLWRREAPNEVAELCTRVVSEVFRPILSRTWGGGGMEIALEVLSVVGGVIPPELAGFLGNGPVGRW